MLERNDSILLVDKEVERQLKIYHTMITIKPFLSSSFLWIIGVSNLLKKRPPPSLIISHGYIKRNGNLKAPPFPTSSHTFATHSSLAMAIGNNLRKDFSNDKSPPPTHPKLYSLTIAHHKSYSIVKDLSPTFDCLPQTHLILPLKPLKWLPLSSP